MLENFSVDVILDPSLILAPRRETTAATLDLVQRLSGPESEFSFYLPWSFYGALIDRERLTAVLLHVGRFFNVPTREDDLGELLDQLEQGRGMLADLVTPFDARERIEKYEWLYDSFAEPLIASHGPAGGLLASILLEEWVFLDTHSWMVSRVKKPFQKFIDAGFPCLQFGKTTVKLLLEKTVKKDYETIDRLDKLRAFGKWTAVGGAFVAPFFAPLAASFVGGIPAVFLLFDPDP